MNSHLFYRPSFCNRTNCASPVNRPGSANQARIGINHDEQLELTGVGIHPSPEPGVSARRQWFRPGTFRAVFFRAGRLSTDTRVAGFDRNQGVPKTAQQCTRYTRHDQVGFPRGHHAMSMQLRNYPQPGLQNNTTGACHLDKNAVASAIVSFHPQVSCRDQAFSLKFRHTTGTGLIRDIP